MAREAIAKNKLIGLLASDTKKKNKAIKLTAEVKHYIGEKLKEYWNPQQIIGCLNLDKGISIITETAYRFVLQDKVVSGGLYKYLRHQHKKYRKRYSKNDYRDRIPNRVDIDERPNVVDTHARIGDWEVNLVHWKGCKGGFATFVERKSRALSCRLNTKLRVLRMRQSLSYSNQSNVGLKL